ncbi:MAG: BlaI/MecI/CopY family transcriptional regulator [Muribaculaceae bacterium]|nr:BlaI/MecI/CopY family transcriptional regulator [Muribaculaceae bacterium]
MAKHNKLTEKEQEIMGMLWQYGPLSVREMLTHYPDPRPHVNTVSTTVRILEEKGFVGHEAVGPGYRYHATARPEDFRDRSLAQVVKSYFNNSYASAVSALVEEEKVSVDELREIIKMIEKRRNS